MAISDLAYALSKLSYQKVLLDSFILYCGISKGILVTFFNIAHASLSQTITKLDKTEL